MFVDATCYFRTPACNTAWRRASSVEKKKRVFMIEKLIVGFTPPPTKKHCPKLF